MPSSRHDPYDMAPMSNALSRYNTTSNHRSSRPGNSRALVLAASSSRDLVTSKGRPRSSSTREDGFASHQDSLPSARPPYHDDSKRNYSYAPSSGHQYENHRPSLLRAIEPSPSSLPQDGGYGDRYGSTSRTLANPSCRYDSHCSRDLYGALSRTKNAASALTTFNRGNSAPSGLNPIKSRRDASRPDEVAPIPAGMAHWVCHNDNDDSGHNDSDGGPLAGGTGSSRSRSSSSYSVEYEVTYKVRLSSSQSRNSSRN